MRYLLLLTILLTLNTKGISQTQLPPKFQQQLQQHNLSFSMPLEQRYKIRKGKKNPYVNYDCVLKSKHLEIRYAFSQSDLPPHLLANTKAMSAGDNEKHNILLVRPLTPEQAAQDFYADWAGEITFMPKAKFSSKRYGILLSFYKANRTQVFVFFLFNKMTDAVKQAMIGMRGALLFGEE